MTEMTDNAAPWPPLKKALWDVIMRANINGGYNNARELTEDLYEAALANPEPPTEARGEVKALEWAKVTDQIPKHAFAAYTPFSRWMIVCEFLSMNHMVYRFDGKDYETLEEAKAAAQADYEKRILSALSHPPAREAVDDAELIAEAMWRAEVDGFSPSASAVRKSAVWADESSNVRARWLGYARVALAALQVKP